MAKKKYLSMRGKEIDMDKMRMQNENTIAVGNANMNTRGDVIKGGKIITRREQVVSDYYKSNPNGVKKVNIKDDFTADNFLSPAEALEKLIGNKDTNKSDTKNVDSPTGVVKRGRKIIDKDSEDE